MSDEVKEVKDDNVVEEVEFVQGGDIAEKDPRDTSKGPVLRSDLQAELKKREAVLNNAVEQMAKLRRQYNELQQVATVTRGAVAQLKELLK